MLNKYVEINNKRIAYRNIKDEAVIIDLKDNTLNVLNPVATFIWESIDNPTQIKDIVEKLSEEFDVDYNIAEKDCFDFISDLIDRNLVIIK